MRLAPRGAHARTPTHSGKSIQSNYDGGMSRLSEVGTLQVRAWSAQPRSGPAPSYRPALPCSPRAQLEFRYLSHVTGDRKYADAVDRISEHLHSPAQGARKSGLVTRRGRGRGRRRACHAHSPAAQAPLFVDPASGRLVSKLYRLGAGADSYYEYLLKQVRRAAAARTPLCLTRVLRSVGAACSQWLQTNCTEPHFRRLYDDAMAGVRQLLLRPSVPNGLAFVGESDLADVFLPKMDHLVCFLPGLLTLGASARPRRDLHPPPPQACTTSRGQTRPVRWTPSLRACSPLRCVHCRRNAGPRCACVDVGVTPPGQDELLFTCTEMWLRSPSGLAPEIAWFNFPGAGPKHNAAHSAVDFSVRRTDSFSLLRPETAESLFVWDYFRGSPAARLAGWRMFVAIERHARVPTGGYTSVETLEEVWAGPSERARRLRADGRSLLLLFPASGAAGAAGSHGELLLGRDAQVPLLALHGGAGTYRPRASPALIGSAQVLPLDKWVLNTEGHPLPVFTPRGR
jgi:hypothetical protein